MADVNGTHSNQVLTSAPQNKLVIEANKISVIVQQPMKLQPLVSMLQL